MNVLLLACDPLLEEFLRRPLEPLGHTLHVVESAKEMREKLHDLQPRAVLLPRRTPDQPVEDLVAWVRREVDEFAIATIIVGLEPRDREVAREVRADGFLLVPFSDADALDVLGATTRAKKLILLADDSPMIHRHTVPILEDAGYEVVSAMDGAEGLRSAREFKPDLIITDIEMPKIDGYEMCQIIKEDDELGHVPVLISSSLGEAQDLERGFDVGADDYLVKPVVPEELTTRVRQLFSGTMPASRERILVVDDSPAQRHYVADCLARQGFEISTAENGREGLEKARALMPALVISDYEMPEMTGFELVHALKRDPETRNLPVIMLTARDSKRDVAQLRAAGASSYLIKPFAPGQVHRDGGAHARGAPVARVQKGVVAVYLRRRAPGRRGGRRRRRHQHSSSRRTRHERPVFRHLRVHDDVVQDVPARSHRATERLLRHPVPDHQGREGRHRQIYRRRHHGRI